MGLSMKLQFPAQPEGMAKVYWQTWRLSTLKETQEAAGSFQLSQLAVLYKYVLMVTGNVLVRISPVWAATLSSCCMILQPGGHFTKF